MLSLNHGNHHHLPPSLWTGPGPISSERGDAGVHGTTPIGKAESHGQPVEYLTEYVPPYFKNLLTERASGDI